MWAYPTIVRPFGTAGGLISPGGPTETLVWREDSSDAGEGQALEDYLAGISGGAPLNLLGWTRAKVDGTATVRYRWRSGVSRWCAAGSFVARLCRYRIDTPADLNGIRYRAIWTPAIRSGSGGSGIYVDLSTDAIGQAGARITVGEDTNTSGAASVGALSVVLYTRRNGVFAARYGQSRSSMVSFEVDLEITPAGALTLRIDGTDVYTSTMDVLGYNFIGLRGIVENASVAYFGNNQDAGWADERISTWI